jgi:hypothetical protein
MTKILIKLSCLCNAASLKTFLGKPTLVGEALERKRVQRQQLKIHGRFKFHVPYMSTASPITLANSVAPIKSRATKEKCYCYDAIFSNSDLQVATKVLPGFLH